MNKIKQLGLIGIISASLIGCSSVPFFKEKTFHKARSAPEIVSYSKVPDRHRMTFVPDRMYTIDNCLVGNYQVIALKSDSLHTRLLVQYYNHKGELFQQALFARDPADEYNMNAMKISVVEVDFDRDGIMDMYMSLQRIVTYDHNEKKITESLKLMDPKKIPMTNYHTPTSGQMYAASSDDK